MLLTSFGYTWLNQFHAATSATDVSSAAGNAKRTYNWRPNSAAFGRRGNETSTLWNYKVVGRYVLPWEIGMSGSWKVQSGRQWGRRSA